MYLFLLKDLPKRCLNQKANKPSCLLKFIAAAYQQVGKDMWEKKGIYRAKDQHSQSIKILFISTKGCIVLVPVLKSNFSFEPECEN